MNSDILIRPMLVSDLTSVVCIEEETFAMPFSHSLFVKFLTHESYYNRVVVKSSEIIGYAMYSYVEGESELINIAVDIKYRHKGVGSKLMGQILDHVGVLGGKKIFLEVRPSNKAAVGFYKSFDFFQVGIRRGYYHDTGEDALVFQRDIPSKGSA